MRVLSDSDLVQGRIAWEKQRVQARREVHLKIEVEEVSVFSSFFANWTQAHIHLAFAKKKMVPLRHFNSS